MKASELRIGNYIKKDGGALWRVSGVFLGNDTVVVVTDDVHFTLPLSEFSPIPITEEWLLKFGFEIKGIANYVTIDFTTYQKGRVIVNDANWIDYDGNWLDMDYKLEYAHQLQNLYFALTGEELIMKT